MVKKRIHISVDIGDLEDGNYSRELLHKLEKLILAEDPDADFIRLEVENLEEEE